MLQLVLAQRGTAVLPYLLVQSYIAEKTLTPLVIGNSPVIARDIIRICRAGRAAPAPLQRLSTQIQQQLLALRAQARNL